MALEEARRPDGRRAHARVRAARRGRPRAPTACRALRQAYVPQPVVGRSAAELRAYIEGTDPITGRPFMQEVIEGLTRPLDEEDLQGPVVRALDAAAARARHRGQPAAAVRARTTGPTSCRSCCRPRSASRRCSKGTSHRAGRGRRPAAADGVPRVLGVHGREGGGQRRDGGRAARVLPGDPRAGGKRRHRAIEQHHFVRDDLASSTARSATRSA